MIRRLALLAAAFLATAETLPPAPAVLTPYLKDGTFDPGDYGYLRGRFDGATAAQVADWAAVQAWLKHCRAVSLAEVRAQLVAAGVTDPAVTAGRFGEAPCGAIDMAYPQADPGKDWALFQTRLASARRIASTLIWSAALAQGVGDNGDTLPARLIARPITDQVLRLSLSWNAGEQKGAPPLDPMEAGIVRALTWSAIRARDHANTAWMKTVVAEHGWPTIAQVGAQASNSAWLLVQHADDDPVFQLRMLRLMEPLARSGQVAAGDYALLYDRVMLQTTGKQRYGTQWTCADGTSQPQALEDRGKVEAYRTAAGLEPLATYGARLARLYGPCPPASH